MVDPQPRDGGGTQSCGGYISHSDYESAAAQKPKMDMSKGSDGDGESSAKDEASEAKDSSNAPSEAKADHNSVNAKKNS